MNLTGSIAIRFTSIRRSTLALVALVGLLEAPYLALAQSATGSPAPHVPLQKTIGQAAIYTYQLIEGTLPSSASGACGVSLCSSEAGPDEQS